MGREGTVIKQKTSASSLVIDPTRVTQLSWTPRFVFCFCFKKKSLDFDCFNYKSNVMGVCRVFLYKGLLTDEECDHFINLVLSINQSSS